MADILKERDFLREVRGGSELDQAEALLASRLRFWEGYFANLWYGAYQFDGLPDTIRSRRLAQYLLYFPAVGVFKPRKSDADPILGLPTPTSFGTYLEPATATFQLPNPSARLRGFEPSREYDVDPFDDAQEAVILSLVPYPITGIQAGTEMAAWQNYEAPYAKFRFYAYQLALLDQLTDQNVVANSHPVLIHAQGMGDANAKELRRMLESVCGSLFVQDAKGKAGLLGTLTPVKLDVPWLLDRIGGARKQIMSDALNLIGVQHTNYEKKERLITDEVQSDVSANSAYREGALALLQDGLDQVGKVFGKEWTLREQEAQDADAEADSGTPNYGGEVRDNGTGGAAQPAGAGGD